MLSIEARDRPEGKGSTGTKEVFVGLLEICLTPEEQGFYQLLTDKVMFPVGTKVIIPQEQMNSIGYRYLQENWDTWMSTGITVSDFDMLARFATEIRFPRGVGVSIDDKNVAIRSDVATIAIDRFTIVHPDTAILLSHEAGNQHTTLMVNGRIEEGPVELPRDAILYNIAR